MKIQLTRDSVCMADDIDAPHETSMEFPDDCSVDEIITRISQAGYLASIAGGNATWSVESASPLAVVAQQWSAPKLLLDVKAAGHALAYTGDSLKLHFRYHAQKDPQVVHAGLLAGALSARTDELIRKRFALHEQGHVRDVLLEECNRQKLSCAGWPDDQMERIWFAVLKLASDGTLTIDAAARLAQTDWRDLLVAAGFADDVTAHESWRMASL